MPSRLRGRGGGWVEEVAKSVWNHEVNAKEERRSMRTGEGICSHGHGPVAVLSAIRVVRSARSPGPAHHVVQKQVPVDNLSIRRRCRRRRRKPLNLLRLPRPRRRLSRAMALAPPPPPLSTTYARPLSRFPSSSRNPHTHPQASSLT